jgi:rhodanese-related sulfurtransferase
MTSLALTLNQKLGALALALGAVAVFSQPDRGPFVKLNTDELAMIVEQEVDHVTPAELAAWIIEGRSDYRLLDLRPPADYDAYHIPTAENVALMELGSYPLSPREKIVIYSEGGIHAAQAWLLMQALGFRGSYTLFGGLWGWQDEVLSPVLAADASPEERLRFEAAASVAKFFGGQPRNGVAGRDDAPAELPKLPQLSAPATPMIQAAPRGRKREGC